MLSEKWQKSSKSGAAGHCVEAAFNASAGDGGAGRIFVRNSKNPFAGIADFSREEWEAFIGGVKDGEFDL
jgi:hypothetical protein